MPRGYAHKRRKPARTLCLWLLLSLPLGALPTLPAAAADAASNTLDASDLWWTASESGWGMQLVEEGGVTFATLYVYDAGGAPIFMAATLSPAGSAWSGNLYRSSGPFFGAPAFDPNDVRVRQVGTLTFERSGSDRATLRYTVDGVAVSKSVARQPLRSDNYSGTYNAVFTWTSSHCSNSADNRAQTAAHSLAIDQRDSVTSLVTAFAKGAVCTYGGDYAQAGHSGAVGTAYRCADGDEGSMSFFDLTRRPGMISGRLQGHSISDSCDYSGAFTGLVPF